VVVVAVVVVGRSFVVVDCPVFVKIHFSWSHVCCYLPAVSIADFDLDLGLDLTLISLILISESP